MTTDAMIYRTLCNGVRTVHLRGAGEIRRNRTTGTIHAYAASGRRLYSGQFSQANVTLAYQILREYAAIPDRR